MTRPCRYITSQLLSRSDDPPMHPQSHCKSFLKSLSTREPSADALRQYTDQLHKSGALKSASSQRLPEHVPKVNSKWDGMPQAPSRRSLSISIFNKSTSGSASAKPSCQSSTLVSPFSERRSNSSSSHDRPRRGSPAEMVGVRLADENRTAAVSRRSREVDFDDCEAEQAQTNPAMEPSKAYAKPQESHVTLQPDVHFASATSARVSISDSTEWESVSGSTDSSSTMSSLSFLASLQPLPPNVRYRSVPMDSIGYISTWPLPPTFCPGAPGSSVRVDFNQQLQPQAKWSGTLPGTELRSGPTPPTSGVISPVPALREETKSQTRHIKGIETVEPEMARPVSRKALSRRLQTAGSVSRIAARPVIPVPNFTRPFSPENPPAPLIRARLPPVSLRPASSTPCMGSRASRPAEPRRIFSNGGMPTIQESDAASVVSISTGQAPAWF